MKKPIFTGCGVALITPFLENSIDYYSLERLLTFHDAKSDAIILLGTTGEASTLSLSERKEIITFSRKIIKKVPLIVGCGGLSTGICKTLVKMAETLSADGILAVTPFYNKSSNEGVIAHYRELSKVSDLPIILYNVPSRTGYNLSCETLAKLWEIPSVNGIKEASSNFLQICDILAKIPDINLWSGDDKLTLPTSYMGGKGVISVAGNLLPRSMRKLSCPFENPTTVKEISRQLFPLFEALFCETNPIPIKYLMSKIGLCENRLRLPLVPLSKSKEILVDKFVEIAKKEFEL